MADLTKETIEELRGLLAKATPGPWEVDYLDKNGQRVIRQEHIEIATFWHHSVGSIEKEMEANAALVVAMRNALPDLLDAAELASRAREDALREDALREAAGVARQAYMRAHRSGDDNSMEPDEIAAAIHALIDKPKGGDANEGRSGTTRETRHPATSPGVTAGASGEAKQVDPDWFWCEIDPDESGDSAYQAMFTYRPRLEPVELCTSYVGPRLWGVMSPPLPDADNDEETAHTFDTREAAQAFCDERNAIFNGAALCPSEGADRG